MSEDRLILLGTGFGSERASSYRVVEAAAGNGHGWRVEFQGQTCDIKFHSDEDAETFDEQLRLRQQPYEQASALLAKPKVLVVTMNDIPGYRIDEVHGDVFGLVVRARNALSNFGASLRTVVGGEVQQLHPPAI